MSNMFARLDFGMHGNEYCCGIYEVGQFSFQQRNIYSRNPVVEKPIERVFKEFDEELRSDLWSNVRDNVNGGTEPGYYWVQCTLVPEAGEEMKLFFDHLKAKKWKTLTKFQNHNTTNEVFVLGKKFKFTALKREFSGKDDDDWC